MMVVIVMLLTMKLLRCRRAYDFVRIRFNQICGNLVDAGNAIWFGLAMYVVSAIFMFFFALYLSRSAHTVENRVRPQRDAVIDFDDPLPPQRFFSGFMLCVLPTL